MGRLKPDPSQPAERVVDIVGLAGDSDRTGYQRLYLTTKLDYYAEFLVQDVVYSQTIPADQSPFPGLEAARVSVRRDATINYTWASSLQPVDEFDLDVRLGAAAAAGRSPEGPEGITFVCVTHVLCPTGYTLCHQYTCYPCVPETRILCSRCKDGTCA